MAEVTVAYEEFIEGNKDNKTGKKYFDDVLKKAVTTKQRFSNKFNHFLLPIPVGISESHFM